jgi:hypothetical protein
VNDLPAITSVEDFVRLRSSSDPAEYDRAAQAEMPMPVWEELIALLSKH